MIKLINLLKEIESNKILVPRRSSEERSKNLLITTQKKIQQYIKDGGKGNLNLSGTPIKSLPGGLRVEGSLNLHNTSITSLPDNLNVGGALEIESSLLASIPNNLKANELVIIIDDVFNIEKEKIKQMIEDKGGHIGGRIYTETPDSFENNILQAAINAEEYDDDEEYDDEEYD
jgi:hypothetical protein